MLHFINMISNVCCIYGPYCIGEKIWENWNLFWRVSLVLSGSCARNGEYELGLG